MEELFEQLKRAVAPAQDSAAKRTATAMDGIPDRMADAAAASYIASVAEDAEFKEEDHPRNTKGGTGGGRFRTSGKTIEREDGHVAKEESSHVKKISAEESMAQNIKEFCEEKRMFYNTLQQGLNEGSIGRFAELAKAALTPEERRDTVERSFLSYANEELYRGNRAYIPWSQDELKELFRKVYKDDMTAPNK